MNTVSLGFMPRPLLSDPVVCSIHVQRLCVAGVYAPAFVERGCLECSYERPGLVSLGFMPRPLLSDVNPFRVVEACPSVAGVYAPAFVERDRGYTERSKGQ